jgi:hypothetical protein
MGERIPSMSRRRLQRLGDGGRGFTTAGIAISIVNILFEVAYVVASIALPDTY